MILPKLSMNNGITMQQEINMASAKLTPPLAASAAILHEATEALPTFILWATAIYTVLQIVLIVKKFFDRKK